MKTKMPESLCPGCNATIDAASPMEADKDYSPRADDLTVCLYCATFLVYKDDLTLRIITEQEIGDLPDDIRIQLSRARKAIHEIKARKH